jgi:3-oxoacyl-(acyl-carrier-protein) synthase
VVMIAPAGCPEAAADLARQAADGRVSPLRYPAAAPSASLGLCCIVFGLRGPTVTLTMSLAAGVPRATWLAGRYLARGDAEVAIVATAEPAIARCVVLIAAGAAGAGAPACEPGSAERWLLDGR